MAAKRAFPKVKSHNVFGQARKMAKMLRAGLYSRVSTNDQQTLTMQSRAMREYAARRGWTVSLQVREVNSGAVKREAREKLLEAARRREIDVVLVWRLDRWGRSVTDLLAIAKQESLQHLGVGFVSLTEALDLDHTRRSRHGRPPLAIFAEFERGDSAGTERGLAWPTPGSNGQKVEAGLPPRPYIRLKSGNYTARALANPRSPAVFRSAPPRFGESWGKSHEATQKRLCPRRPHPQRSHRRRQWAGRAGYGMVHCYLDDNIRFPFQAKCIAVKIVFSLSGRVEKASRSSVWRRKMPAQLTCSW